METGLEAYAYTDKAYPIAAEQTISQPYTVAFQTELLAINPGDKVLEIGTGSGYQTAVLLQYDIMVYTLERQHELFKKTSLLFNKLKLRPKKVIFGDGYKGYPIAAPYDGIIVTAGAPIVPNPLLEQLSIGGRLVIPVGKKEQIMTRFIRKNEKEFDKETFGSFRFVPLLENKN
jgi:protein-L-isoaspartate(D-aspartate) O-methyltransferase